VDKEEEKRERKNTERSEYHGPALPSKSELQSGGTEMPARCRQGNGKSTAGRDRKERTARNGQQPAVGRRFLPLCFWGAFVLGEHHAIDH
jgi:hypothetical protein